MKTVYLPSNLDLDVLFKTYPPAFDYEIENFMYIIGVLIHRQVQQKSLVDEGFTPLHSKLLQERVRNYNHYLRHLIDAGVILTNGRYVPDKVSTGYKLAQDYVQGEYVPVLLTKWNLIKTKPKEVEQRRWLRKHYSHLTKWFNESLEIDFIGAKECLHDLREQEEIHGYKSKSEKPVQTTASERYYLRLLNVEKIKRKEFTCSVDSTSNRFHSNMTGLKSEARNYLTYDNKKLCSVDVKNSQPFLSTVFLNHEFYSKQKWGFNLNSISPIIYKQIKPNIPTILQLLSKQPNIIMLVKDHVTQCRGDLELYCTLVDKGLLYGYLSGLLNESTGIKLDMDIPADKRLLKSWLFWILYSTNQYKPWEDKGKFRNLFRKIFPTVYKIFSLVKQHNNAVLPTILQQVESEIILRRTTRVLNKAYPDLPLFTVHDSIATISGKEDLIYWQLKADFENVIGLTPSLQIEKWIVEKPQATFSLS